MADVLPNAHLDGDDEHVIPPPPPPADHLGRYTVDRDPASEQDITDYVEGQARHEHVQHLEKIKTEIIVGDKYDCGTSPRTRTAGGSLPTSRIFISNATSRASTICCRFTSA